MPMFYKFKYQLYWIMEFRANETNRVAPNDRVLKHQFLKHRLPKHLLFTLNIDWLKHRLAKTSTGENSDWQKDLLSKTSIS
jgi:hypothetical protein